MSKRRGVLTASSGQASQLGVLGGIRNAPDRECEHLTSFGLHVDLRKTPCLAQRLEQVCTVCRRAIAAYVSAQNRANALALGGPYAVCPCCHQLAPDPKDRNYRRRARRWLARCG